MRRTRLNDCFLYAVAILTLSACNNADRPKHNTSKTEVSVPKKPPSSYQDTFLVDRKSIIFYYPDSIQMVKLWTVVDSGALSSILHEYEYLEKNARNVMKESYPEIPILQSKNKRYLLFRSGARDSCIDLDQQGDPIGLYLFMPGKNPHLADLPNINSDLSAYFSGY